MISSISIHEIADLELNEAAQYYESKVTGLGFAFLSEVERVIEQIQNNPESAPRIRKAVRRKLLRGFPYSIMYSIVVIQFEFSRLRIKRVARFTGETVNNLSVPA